MRAASTAPISASDEFGSGERIYLTRASSDTASLHLERYRLAHEQARQGAVILDAACGSGYGSELLAGRAAAVIGIDLSRHALDYARVNHREPNLVFAMADLPRGVPLEDESVDMVVSLETLEHVLDQDNLLSEFWRVLRPDGVIVISTPDRDVISHMAFCNDFHIGERSKAEFVDLIARRFTITELYGQVRYGLPGWKRILKVAVKADVLRLRRAFFNALHLRRFFWRHFVPMQVDRSGSNLDRVELHGIGHHYYLVAVARKGRSGSASAYGSVPQRVGHLS